MKKKNRNFLVEYVLLPTRMLSQLSRKQKNEREAKTIDVNMSSMSMGGRPTSEDVLKDSAGQKIEKLCGQSEWQPRFLCLTAEKLLIFHSECDQDIADQIPLVSLVSPREVFLPSDFSS